MNAIVGDNGIITQAQSANVQSGMSVLEEYLQEEYVRYYGDSENYVNKVELLSNYITNLLLTNSASKKYIIYEGKAYYILNKKALPDEIRDALAGGNSEKVEDYSKLIDVYGITTDLKVYYIDTSTNTQYGSMVASDIDPNSPLAKVNHDTEMNSAISSALNELGIEVDPELGITTGNVSSIKSLTLDGSKNNITDLSAISELTSLKELTLKNLTLGNLNGLESLYSLNYIYFYNCNITDYSKLSTAYKLKYLYFYFPTSMSETIANSQINSLGEGLKGADKITSLEYLYIVGELSIFSSADNNGWNMVNRGFFTYNSGTRSNLSDISGLANLPSNIKSTVKYLYLNNHKINSISALADFTSLQNVILMCNSNLESLTGLENKTKLLYLGASYGGFSNLEGIRGDTQLTYLTAYGNQKLTSLSGLNTSLSLKRLYVQDCKLTSISDLEGSKSDKSGLDSLIYLNLTNNNTLVNVASIAKCDSINELYLAGCSAMSETEVSTLESTILRCGNRFNMPSNYYLAFSNITTYDLSGNSVTDSQIEVLRNKTNIKRLRLNSCTSLTDAKMNSVLSTMTGLKYLSLYNCSNLSNITFASNMKLVELDLRNTKVTDLSPLNGNSSSSLATLYINNASIPINSYQTLLTNVFSNSNNSGGTNSWISEYAYQVYGLLLGNSNVTITVPAGATKFYSGSMCNGTTTFDLSKCNSIRYIHVNGSGNKYILPASLVELFMEVGSGCTFDFSRCTNLTTISRINGATDSSMNTSFATMPENNKLNSLTIRRSSLTKLEFLGKFNASPLKSLRVDGWSWNEAITTSFISTQGIENATELTSLYINYTYLNNLNGLNSLTKLQTLGMTWNELKDITNLNSCVSLKTIDLNHNKINSISSLENLTQITSLTLNNNKLSIIPNLSKLTALTTINLSENSISDLSNLNSIINSESKTSLRTLNISSNPVEDYSANGFNNYQLLQNLKAGGCSSIIISNTALSDL